MGMCVCGGAAIACSFGAAPSRLRCCPTIRRSAVCRWLRLWTTNPGKYLALRHVYVHVQPTGGGGHSRGHGGADPDACMPGDYRALGARCPTVLIGNKPALNQTSKLMCSWGGVIQITNPGTMNIQVP